MRRFRAGGQIEPDENAGSPSFGSHRLYIQYSNYRILQMSNSLVGDWKKSAFEVAWPKRIRRLHTSSALFCHVGLWADPCLNRAAE